MCAYTSSDFCLDKKEPFTLKITFISYQALQMLPDSNLKLLFSNALEVELREVDENNEENEHKPLTLETPTQYPLSSNFNPGFSPHLKIPMDVNRKRLVKSCTGDHGEPCKVQFRTLVLGEGSNEAGGSEGSAQGVTRMPSPILELYEEEIRQDSEQAQITLASDEYGSFSLARRVLSTASLLRVYRVNLLGYFPLFRAVYGLPIWPGILRHAVAPFAIRVAFRTVFTVLSAWIGWSADCRLWLTNSTLWIILCTFSLET
ncbi:hypothetical protein BDQ17DRAFT_1320913 [Cyathus striatus]|nr:hypothetical protein BDQ17DRAFT_1320913 [Cyathus striatus]